MFDWPCLQDLSPKTRRPADERTSRLEPTDDTLSIDYFGDPAWMATAVKRARMSSHSTIGQP